MKECDSGNEQVKIKTETFFDSIFSYFYGVLSLRKKSDSNVHLEIEIHNIDVLKKIAITSHSVDSLTSRNTNKTGFDVQYLFSKININDEMIKLVEFKGDFDSAELHVISSEYELENPVDEMIPCYFDLLLSAKDYEQHGGW